MPLIRPRLNDYYDLPFTQEEVDFVIPFLDEDIPLCVDPFLLWKSPSQQDNALHTHLISSFNNLGFLFANSQEKEAINLLTTISECYEVGLGDSKTKQGHKIGEEKSIEILSLFKQIPQIKSNGFEHIEEIQLFIDQISKDRISDITCSIIKSFLIDFTIDQCNKLKIPRSTGEVTSLLRGKFVSETIDLPINPLNSNPVILVPKRWLRYIPWINFDDYFRNSIKKDSDVVDDTKRVEVLNYNRHNYDVVQVYIKQKERIAIDCKNDPLFKPVPVISAKKRLSEIKKLPTGNVDKADKRYEDSIGQLMASLLYPYLDFAEGQSRTDSGVLIRDLIFYNNRSFDFLEDIYNLYQSRQIVMELKNVADIEREHINQLNRYLNEQFGSFGVIITRKRVQRKIYKNLVDLWAGQRKCILVLTDEDIELMVTLFESNQRLPIEVIKKVYVEFTRDFPS